MQANVDIPKLCESPEDTIREFCLSFEKRRNQMHYQPSNRLINPPTNLMYLVIKKNDVVFAASVTLTQTSAYSQDVGVALNF